MKELLTKISPDVVILQETKLKKFDRKHIKSIWSLRHIGPLGCS